MARAAVLASASGLVSRAKSLESQRSDLLKQIESETQRIESQKHDGMALAALLLRDELPSRRATKQRLTELQSAIDEEHREQSSLRARSARLQASIDTTIALRHKQTQYDKLATDLKALAIRIDDERKREATLKFQQTQLASELLKARLTKKRLAEQLAADPAPPIEMAPLQRKKRSLLDQRRLLQAKREAFEQELAESVDELERLRNRQAELGEMTERAEAVDPADLQRQIIQSAAENTELRVYRPVPIAAENLLDELTQLAESCASLLDSAQTLIE
jgi:hypothetical protein